MHQLLQPRERNSHATKGCLNNHPLGKSEKVSHLQHSDEEDNNIQLHLSSAEINPETDTHPHFLSSQTSDDHRCWQQSQQIRNRSNNGSLNWFDNIVGDIPETEKSIDELSVAKTSQDNLALKEPNAKSCTKEKSSLRKSKQAEMGESLPRTAPGGSCRQTIASGLEGGKAEKPINFPSGANEKSACAAPLPDSMVTHKASKKWQRMNIGKAHGFCASTPDPEAGDSVASFSPHPVVTPQFPARDLNASASHSVSRVLQKLITSTEKCSRDQRNDEATEGHSDQPEIPASSGLTAAKQTNISFRQKTTMLANSYKNEDRAEFPDKIYDLHTFTRNVPKGERLQEQCSEKCHKEHSINNMGKQLCDNKSKEEKKNKAFVPSSTKKKRSGDERLDDLNVKKVCSSTIVKLAGFSFMPLAKSKPQTPAFLHKASNDKPREEQLLKTQNKSTGHTRKCFELGNASIVTGKSLFSISDADDAILDFDWDEELKNCARS